METLLADEEAKEAKLRAFIEKKALAGAVKAEAGANAAKREQEAEQARSRQRDLVTDIQSQCETPAQAASQIGRDTWRYEEVQWVWGVCVCVEGGWGGDRGRAPHFASDLQRKVYPPEAGSRRASLELSVSRVGAGRG